MLTNTLNTNEVKNASAAEVEFSRIGIVGRTTEYRDLTETPAYPHRLKISHQETGKESTLRRRSVVRIDKTVNGADSSPTRVSAYAVVDIPSGNLANDTEAKNCLAELMSFLATTGAATTVLFDCSGNGANALVKGEL